MARKRLSAWTLFVMSFFVLLFYGCGLSETTTFSPPIPTETSITPDTPITSEVMNDLEFMRLFVPTSMKEEEIPSQIHVITGDNSPLPDVIAQISEDNQLILDNVDYSHNFVLFMFMGHQNVRGPKKEVTRIWQTDSIIYIQANFHKQSDPTVIPGFTYPKEAIKVSKDNMSQFGEITLILLDQDGKQRAISTCNIFE